MSIQFRLSPPRADATYPGPASAGGPEHEFLRGVLLYVLVGLAVVSLARADGLESFLAGLREVPADAFSAVPWVGPLPVAFIGGIVLIHRAAALRRIALAAGMALVTALFAHTFTAIKTSLPEIVPFYADPFLARADSWLHGGHAPWKLTHALLQGVPPGPLARIYLEIWLFPAIFFPVLLALADGDPIRRRRFLRLHLLAWIGLGNLLALAGMSAGPVYFQRLTGSDGLAGLHEALAASGISETSAGRIQDHLWFLYRTGTQSVGSGISAFPSVHVAMAAVLGVYLYERCRAVWPASVLLVLTYLVLSVHLGWHYALDGYASIALVLIAWAGLRRIDQMHGTAPAP